MQQNFVEPQEKSLGHERVFIEWITVKNNKHTYNSRLVLTGTKNWWRGVESVLSRITYTSWITFSLPKCFLTEIFSFYLLVFKKAPASVVEATM